MLETGLRKLTGERDKPVLQKLFKRNDVIGLKFNRCDGQDLAENKPLAEVLVKMFEDAGFGRGQLVLMQLDHPDLIRSGVQAAPYGWTERQYDLAGGSDALAGVVEKVTAMVNIPQLRAEPISGMAGCLHNLAFDLTKHPGRFFGQDVDAFIADVCALPIVGGKVRLNVVNALNLLIRCDLPVLDERSVIHGYGGLLFSTDMVAADAVGLEILDRARASRKLPPLTGDRDVLGQLVRASKRGLGVYHRDQIDLDTLMM